jgi:hypothetical protein
MSSDTKVGAAALLFFVTAAVVYFRPRTQRNPPGPKPLPVIGNLLDFPIDAPELVYDQWKEKYGAWITLNSLPYLSFLLMLFRRHYLYERYGHAHGYLEFASSMHRIV